MVSQPSEPILACNISAIPQEYRPVHQSSIERIFSSAQEMQELPTGYVWRFPNETDLLPTIAVFLQYERLCCPFFHFTLEIEPNHGAIWLKITGSSGVKAFIEELASQSS